MRAFLFFLFPLFFQFLPNQSQTAMTPGFQFLGRGYDIYYGNPEDTSGNGDQGWREQMFQFTTTSGQKTPDNQWLVPDGTQSLLLSSCSLDQSETLINDAYDYQNTVVAGFGIDLNLFGASFQFSIDSKHIAHTTFEKESIYAQLQSTCAAYQLNVNAFKPPPFNDEFLAGVDSLTDLYDEGIYMYFIQIFGTHYARSLRLGGRWGWLIEMDRKSFQKMLDDGVDWNMGLKYAGKVTAGINANGSDDTNSMAKIMQTVLHNYSFNIGGDYKPDSGEWMASVRADPMPLGVETVPIWQVVTSHNLPSVANITVKQSNLKNATENYCKWLQNNGDPNVSCQRPTPLPKPTPGSSDPDPNSVSSICVHNNGGFALSWRLIKGDPFSFLPSSVHADSDSFAAGGYRCLDANLVQAQKGDTLTCTINIIGGKHDFNACGLGVKYDARSTLAANYVCGGGTMTPNCKFDGFSS